MLIKKVLITVQKIESCFNHTEEYNYLMEKYTLWNAVCTWVIT